MAGARPPLPRREVWLFCGAVLLLVVCYVAAASWIASTRSIWSPDCGARLIQVQSILQHWPHWWVSYPGSGLDPYHLHSPLSFYEFSHGGHTYVFYSFLFALISAVFYAQLGYLGLAVLPLVCGVGAAAATYGVARLLGFRYPVAPMLIVGLATPLAVYSVVFWDHSITTCVAAICMYLCVRGMMDNRPVYWVAAGMAFGAGLWIHEILVPYLPAMIVGAWWMRRSQPWLPRAAYVLAGAALLILPLAVVNHSVYGTPLGPHLSNNHLGSSSDILHILLSPSVWVPGALYTLFAWGDASPGFATQLHQWLIQPWPQFQWENTMSLKMSLPLIFWMLLALFGMWRQQWMAALILMAGMLASGFVVLLHPAWPHSLFYASPILALAFAAFTTDREAGTGRDPEADAASKRETGHATGSSQRRRKQESRRPADTGQRKDSGPSPDPRSMKAAVAAMTLVYTCGALLNPALGGSEYGSRYLLITVPGLVLLGWSVIETLLPAPGEKSLAAWPTSSRVLAGTAGAMLLLSMALQAHGIQVVHNMQLSNRALADSIENTPDDVVLTSVWWAPLDGAPAYPKKKILYVGDTNHIYGNDPHLILPPLLDRMARQNIRTFAAIGYDYSDLQAYAPGAGANVLHAGYVPFFFTPTGLGLKLTRFELP